MAKATTMAVIAYQAKTLASAGTTMVRWVHGGGQK